jgi:integrase
LFNVALTVGLRQGELLGLRWRDIDFGARTLRVSKALQRVEGQLVLVEPKTRLSRRTIPFPEATVATVRKQWARQATNAIRRRSSATGTVIAAATS